MKHKSKWISIVATATLIGEPSVVSPVSQVHATTSDVSQGQEGNIENSVTITNTQILKGATRAYEDGKITETEYNTIRSGLSQRIGVKGETKIVQIDNETIDVYLDSRLAALLLQGIPGAVAASLFGISAAGDALGSMGLTTAILTAALKPVISNVMDTSNGVIVTMKKVPKPMPGGYTEPGWVGSGVRDQ